MSVGGFGGRYGLEETVKRINREAKNANPALAELAGIVEVLLGQVDLLGKQVRELQGDPKSQNITIHEARILR